MNAINNPQGSTRIAAPVMDAVQSATVEMGHTASVYYTGKEKAFAFDTGVPYGMTSRELAAWVRILGGQQIWDEIYDQFGVQVSEEVKRTRG